jgi:hypothetical protein
MRHTAQAAERAVAPLPLPYLAVATVFELWACTLIDSFDWNWGWARAFALTFIAIPTPFLVRMARLPEGSVPPRIWALLRLAIATALGWHLFVFFAELPDPARMIDLPLRTLDAGDAMLRGKLPYQLAIDLEPRSLPGVEHITGYKYMPLMPVVYMPLGQPFRKRGVLATNLLLDLMTAALVFALARRAGGRAAGRFAALLYMAVPMVVREVLISNVTDLSAEVPLLLAILLFDRRPGLAGLCLGLSISVKLLPGVLLLPCCLPPRGRHRFALGVVAGLTPAVVALALCPVEFLQNVVIFNARRPPDSTSWLFQMPAALAVASRLAFAFAWLAYAAWSWVTSHSQTLSQRCGAAVLLILGSLVSGPVNHRNYQLWWLPFFAVVLGVAATRASRDSERHWFHFLR